MMSERTSSVENHGGLRRVAAAALLLFGIGFAVTSWGFAAQAGSKAETELMSQEMGGDDTAQQPDMLFADPERVGRERQSLTKKLRSAHRNKKLRPLYEKYIDRIGANGILDGIEKIWPKCHSTAHDLGKVIFAKVRDIGLGVRICSGRCHSGCMHGVLMEAFTTLQSSKLHHIGIQDLRPLMNDTCFQNKDVTAAYRPGDCAHGVGHALMYLAKYEIARAVDACDGFTGRAMKYSCITGAYMEYVVERHQEDKRSRSLFYPCDSHPYPTACGRYKVHFVKHDFHRQGKGLEALIAKCLELKDNVRRGCFHGLGNTYMSSIARQKLSIRDVCLFGDAQDQLLCIEGAMERMGKYHAKRARETCEDLEGKQRKWCRDAAERKMYHKDKDLTLYLKP